MGYHWPTKMTNTNNKEKVLIFVVAYNAEKTIAGVLERIPLNGPLANFYCEVLVIDDSSKDGTSEAAQRWAATSAIKTVVVKTPFNQGYGGNQKIGYQYALEGGFDYVVLIHGDGQYGPENIPVILEQYSDGASAVFGSRMLDKKHALAGGMPLYKWIGNQVLTRYQNAMTGESLSEWHSGYRSYRVSALAKIPFQRNADGFSFDTDIIIQLVLAKMLIVEVPIPTFYGDEVCHVDGLAYAWRLFWEMIRMKLHQKNLFYDRKFDVGPPEDQYTLKMGYASSHTLSLNLVKPGARILDIGCGQGAVSAMMIERGAASVCGLDRFPPKIAPDGCRFYSWDGEAAEMPVSPKDYDQIFLLDIIEHLSAPEEFLDYLRGHVGIDGGEVIITTGNIGFVSIRIGLLLGQFNYGKVGILDRTHTRLFTFGSMREALTQAGYEIVSMDGVPAPFPKALGLNAVSRLFTLINRWLIKLCPGLFSYQMLIRARIRPPLSILVATTCKTG